MDLDELKRLYIENGLDNFKLRDVDDLLNVHKIDYTLIKGYDKLDDLSRRNFGVGLINIYNGHGVNARRLINPKGIYFVEDVDYYIERPNDEDLALVIGGLVTAIYNDGEKEVIKEWVEDDYKIEDHTGKYIRNYLRFEYDYDGRNEWLHITKNGEDWY